MYRPPRPPGEHARDADCFLSEPLIPENSHNNTERRFFFSSSVIGGSTWFVNASSWATVIIHPQYWDLQGLSLVMVIWFVLTPLWSFDQHDNDNVYVYTDRFTSFMAYFCFCVFIWPIFTLICPFYSSLRILTFIGLLRHFPIFTPLFPWPILRHRYSLPCNLAI